MADHFTYQFKRKLPTLDFEQEWKRYKDLPLLGDVIDSASETISKLEAFQALPVRNQRLLLDMSRYMLTGANHIHGDWDNSNGNFWGLYVVGSRARGEATPQSDLDMLSVGTFFRHTGFFPPEWDHRGAKIFDGFDVEVPKVLPGEYNVGMVSRKYLERATPQVESESIKMLYPKPKPVLPVDLSVVDLTFTGIDLESFKTERDVDQNREVLPRVPIVELSVVSTYF